MAVDWWACSIRSNWENPLSNPVKKILKNPLSDYPRGEFSGAGFGENERSERERRVRCNELFVDRASAHPNPPRTWNAPNFASFHASKMASAISSLSEVAGARSASTH